jgi:nucleoside-diphosphate-sugar epimerase
LDPEEELMQLTSQPLNELIASTRKVLGKYPNTYTYTKSLCERLLKKRQGGVPLCIVRPAIINTSVAEPFPGWIDSIAAAAALFMFIGLGIVHEIKGNPKKIGDTVPVDVVVATIIIASAFNFGTKTLPIYHVGSSDRNPLTWG